MINFQELIRLLDHHKPSVRLMSIHVLRMVDEVQALDAIRSRLLREDHAKVAHEFEAVADYLAKLRRNGYNTVATICQQFNVYSDVLLAADEDKFEIVYRMVRQLQERPEESIHNKSLLISLSLVSRELGELYDVSVSEARKKLKRRIAPNPPSHGDISQWANLLKSDNPMERDHALMRLSLSNNSVSLQYMAHTYMTDPEQKIRDTAKRLGRKLYWNRIYYDMEQDGTLDAIIKEFAISLRLIEDDRPKQTTRSGVTDILSLAENERKKRGWEQ